MDRRRREPSVLSHARSDVPGVVWPPASGGPAAVLMLLLRHLEETQWLPAAELRARQHEQLARAAQHAKKHSKYFRARLARARLKPDDLGSDAGLRRLPVMRRRDIQSAGDDLFCAVVPAGHTPVSATRTSGSTGEPVTIKRTAINHLDWLAMTMREHLWQGRDFSGRMAAVRGNEPYRERNDWGPPVSFLFPTGRSAGIPLATDIARQVELLQAFRPDNLIVYPSNLAALTARCRVTGTAIPGLRSIRTIGETLSSETRTDAEEVLHARVTDAYSSQEFGYIALQCPVSGLYHTTETVIVEILDDAGAPCPEGTAGHVVVTDLHNLATPLVRYDIGDWAVPGPQCPCGRGLPTLKSILGRQRNLVLMPDGTRHWPMAGFQNVRSIAPVRQSQFIQHSREKIEVRLVVERPLGESEQAQVAALIHKILGHSFALKFVYFDERIPPGPGGKFEHFICKAQ